jgi:hypothetical protein
VTDKYWIVTHEVHPPQYALHGSVARPGMAISAEDPVSHFDKMVDDIRLDAHRLSGISPTFVDFVAKSRNMKDVTLRWCLFDGTSALAFAMLVSGKITERDWPIAIDELSDEEKLVAFFDVVVSNMWTEIVGSVGG